MEKKINIDLAMVASQPSERQFMTIPMSFQNTIIVINQHLGLRLEVDNNLVICHMSQNM